MSHTIPLFSENDSPDNSQGSKLRQQTREVLRLLWKDWDFDKVSSPFNAEFVSHLWSNKDELANFYQAILLDRDAFMLKAARLEIQASLDMVMQHLQDLQHSSFTVEMIEKIDISAEEYVMLTINNILSFYAMFSPTPHETVQVPQWINEQWQAVDYSIEPLELTPQKGFWRWMLGDQGRLFSYGLTPVNNDKASRILLHKGTGWPTAQGVTIQLLADIWPNKTPGEIFFEWSADKINLWLDSQPGKVKTCGVSLGGALSFLTALHRPDKISRSDCLNPPGMFIDYSAEHSLFGAWEETHQNQRPEVWIQKQSFDPVSKCGVFKKDFRLLKINVNQTDRAHKLPIPLKLVVSHARSLISCNEHLCKIGDIEKENNARQRLDNNRYLYGPLRTIAFYTILLPYFFIFRPMVNFMAKHAHHIISAIFIYSFLCFFPPATALLSLSIVPNLGSVFYTALLPSLMLNNALLAVLLHSHDLFFNQQLRLRAYFQKLNQSTAMDKLSIVLYDLINLLSFGLLSITSHYLHKFFIDLPHALFTEKNYPATVHSVKLSEQTTDINNHPEVGLAAKLHVASFILLYAAVYFPIHFVLHDLPRFIFHQLPQRLNQWYQSNRANGPQTLPQEFEQTIQNRPKQCETSCWGRFFAPVNICSAEKIEAQIPHPKSNPNIAR